jgi:hypothetical protein
MKAAIATGHEVHADVQDLHKDIRGLKGVGVFSVSLDSCELHFYSTDLLAEMGQVHLTRWQTSGRCAHIHPPPDAVRRLPEPAPPC